MFCKKDEIYNVKKKIETTNYCKLENSFLYENKKFKNYKINKNLALLLSTSGTTGSKKFVRISYKNLYSNSKSIVQYLNLNKNDKAIKHIRKAIELNAKKDSYYGTDEGSLVEYLGERVKIVPGSELNIKITRKEDLVLGESLLSRIR